VGLCHHSIARLQVAVGGTASNMEGSCEYIEYVVVDSRQVVVLQLEGLGERLKLLTGKTYHVSKQSKNTCDCGNELSGCTKCWEFLD